MTNTRDTKRSSKDWRERVGAAVRATREARGITQAELASAIGVDVATISKTERGETVPDYATIEAVADFLGTTVDQLTGRVADGLFFNDRGAETLMAIARGEIDDSYEAVANALAALASEIIRNRAALRRLTKPPGAPELP